jgi:radical SAM protein with 4Fe4S-binding SPASM domain
MQIQDDTDEARVELLPPDSALLPFSRGELLISRQHALFCPIPAGEASEVRAILAGEADVSRLTPALRAELERHGFGGGPREAKDDGPSVQLQLTNGCNLACSYCCTNSGTPRARELDRAQAMAIVDEAREVLGAGARVAILGGEPLLVPWALDVAEHAVDLGMSLTLFTNGLPLVDEALARRTAALTCRGAQVRVSLAGPTPELCDAASGTTRFETVMRAVAEVARCGGEAIVDLMLMPGQVEEIAAAFPSLRRRLPPGTKISLGVLYLSGREQGEHLFFSRAALESALDRIAFEAGEVIPATTQAPIADRREGCTCALGHHLHVRSDGALFTCFKMEEKVGDLTAQRFGDAVRAVRSQPHPASTLPICADCALATLCGGGCRSENLQYTGDPDQPVCGPWRVRVLTELLAEDRVSALDWPAIHLLSEARSRGIEAPERLVPVIPSRHLRDI